MADKSKIEWTEASWNPVAGCAIVSPGCTNCYAMRMASRLEAMGVETYAGLTRKVKGKPVWTGEVRQAPESILLKPLSWKRPRAIFVNSMSDLFAAPGPTIDRVLAVMALAPQHTYQVLTKRAREMREHMNDPDLQRRVALQVMDNAPAMLETPVILRPGAPLGLGRWPLSNVWLGVSVEDQTRADERREDLKAVADAGWLTWVSYEPALGPVDWSGWEFIRWLVSGGESGSGARPSHPDWHRVARGWCAGADVAYFFKQWGEFAPAFVSFGSFIRHDAAWPGGVPGSAFTGAIEKAAAGAILPGEVRMLKFGKRAAGRLLDGREHNARPAVRALQSEGQADGR